MELWKPRKEASEKGPLSTGRESGFQSGKELSARGFLPHVRAGQALGSRPCALWAPRPVSVLCPTPPRAPARPCLRLSCHFKNSCGRSCGSPPAWPLVTRTALRSIPNPWQERGARRGWPACV
uniref:Uncharacterized protein n=1 Tax=Molossus molossus TaxID=27622 RepID=A0A7J8I0P0_MOLMO|nr:hypothetical protein HJG59_010744 [Molossus molossus]